MRLINSNYLIPFGFMFGVNGYLSIVFWLTFLIYGCRAKKNVIPALFIATLFVFLNPGLFPGSNEYQLLKHFLVLSFATSMLVQRPFLQYRVILLCGLAACLVLHSVFFSIMADVSILKITSYFLYVITIYMSFSSLNGHNKFILLKKLCYFLNFSIVISTLLLASSYGYLRNGINFQGIFNHPQSYAIILTTSVMLNLLMINKSTNKKLYWSFLLLTFFHLLQTSSRTGIIASVVIFLYFINYCYAIPKSFWMVFFKRFGIVSLVLVMFLNIGTVLNKNNSLDSSVSLAESYEVSRGFLFERMLFNILNQPYSGIGFGIASIPEEMDVSRFSFLNLPYSAPIEKGIIAIAVIEEVGLLIGGLFFVYMLYLGYRLHRYKNEYFFILIGIILINLGEFVFFSPGGIGLLVIISFVAVLDANWRIR
jgi:hypothetical protein